MPDDHPIQILTALIPIDEYDDQAVYERIASLEQALRDLIAACKTSGRIVGYNSDAVDRAEAVLNAKGE